MGNSTEFRERLDHQEEHPTQETQEERSVRLLVNFSEDLAHRDLRITREFAWAQAGVYNNEVPPTWLNKDTNAQDRTEAIFTTFQEATREMNPEERTQACEALARAMIGPVEAKLPGPETAAMDWYLRGVDNLYTSLKENDDFKYLTSMNQLSLAWKMVETEHRTRETRDLRAQREEREANHFNRYRATNQHTEPPREKIAELLELEISRQHPEFGAQFSALKDMPVRELAQNWPLGDPEQAELLFWINDAAADALGTGYNGKLVMESINPLTASLNRQNHHLHWTGETITYERKLEGEEIARDIRETGTSAMRALRNRDRDEYNTAVERLNEIQNRLAGASG